MAAKKNNRPENNSSNLIQLTLPGLIILCLSLLMASALLTGSLTAYWLRTKTPAVQSTARLIRTTNSAATPAWGDLITYNIELERPEEYVALETSSNRPPSWTFEGMTLDSTRAAMLNCGLTADQVQSALSPDHTSINPESTVVNPSEDLVLSLSPPVRGKLYQLLGQWSENHYMRYPFIFSGKSFETIASNSKQETEALALVRRLLYPRGDDQCLSDFELVMRRTPEESNRVQLVQALSRQTAVLARLRVTPDTDIEKLIGYWSTAPGVRVKDIRPLLESLKNAPDGGTVSLLYFLPQFARQRLYTFPMPPKPGEPRMDCHWSTMNFFKEVPDNRFNDSSYTAKYLDQYYYNIAKPNAYGDLIFLLDDKNQALHSAVYIADDIVFTKNGDNYLQPWMFMHLKDLTGMYSTQPPLRMLVYRSKSS